MAQRRRRATTSKTKRGKAKAGRRPKRKAAPARKKAPRRAGARTGSRPDRNAARVAELEAENRRLREELERVRAESGTRSVESHADLPPDESPPTDF